MSYLPNTYKFGSSSTTVSVRPPSSSLPPQSPNIQTPPAPPTNGSKGYNLEIWIPSGITLLISLVGGVTFYFSTITDIKNSIATLSADQKNLISKVDDLQKKSDTQSEKLFTLEKDLIRIQMQNEYRLKSK